MKILVIAPHPDDEAIGCGGTLALHLGRGDSVSVIFLTSGELGLKELPREEAWRIREEEACRSAATLGLNGCEFLRLPDWYVGDDVDRAANAIAPLLFRYRPDVIYLPHPLEWHPDHAASLPATRAAIAIAGITSPALLAYEIWTPLGSFDHVEDISSVMELKLAAIECYRSQLAGFAYDRAVIGLNQYRGALAAKCDFAEVFSHIP